jgi:hypothetical protein
VKAWAQGFFVTVFVLGVSAALGLAVHKRLMRDEPPDLDGCVHLVSPSRANTLIVRNGRFMLCEVMNEQSLDVECRELEEKPCRK